MQSSQRQPSRCRGTTLIEVLAGLIILGTLLVSVSIARARFLNQWMQADQSLRATKAADKLLATWLSGSLESVPTFSEGPLPETPGYVWRTHTIRDEQAQTLGASIIRLEVFNVTANPQMRANPNPILSVDFLLHQTSRKTSQLQPR